MELEGHVEEPQFLRYLVEMGRDRFTGAVRLENEELIKILYLQDGNIISASTNDPAESVDELLLRAKKVGREHIQQALVKRKMDETLGDALLNAGFITRKELRWARRHQIVSVLRSALAGSGWHYTIVPDYVSTRSSEGTHFPVEPLLVELVVTDPDRDRVDQRLSGGEVRLRKAPNFEERYPHLGLNEDADRVAALVDGKRTAAEIASEAGGNGFMNLKLLAALNLLGVVEVNPEAQEQLEISFGHGASPEAPLLPGIMARPPLDIPQWEVESLPDPASNASDDAVDLDLEPAGEPSVVDETPWYAEEPVSEPSPEAGGAPESPSWESRPVADAPAPSIQEFDVPAGWSDTAAGLFEEEPPAEMEPLAEEEPEGTGHELFEHVAPGAPLTPKRSSRKRWFLGAAILLAGVVALGLLLRPFANDESPVPAPQGVEREPLAVEALPGTTTIAPAGEESVPASTTEGEASTAVLEEPDDSDDADESGSSPVAESAPAVAAAPADTPLRQRYDMMADEYRSAAAEVPYTIQFEIVCETASVTLALNEGGTPVWFIPIQYRERPCYRVFWGRYETEEAAAAATAEIPASLRGGRPVVVRPERIVQ